MSTAERRDRRHRWEELLPEEFEDEFARAPIVYWPCGAVEEHGLQSSLGVDPLTAHEVCLRAVARSGGIVHPPIYLAPAGIPSLSRDDLRARTIELYPPSLWVSREACDCDDHPGGRRRGANGRAVRGFTAPARPRPRRPAR
jgi:hypothetical protein